MRLCVYALLQLWLLYDASLSFTVTERAPPADISLATANNTTSYRVSQPRPQQPSNRVPTHLQGIRTGFAYEDADDVIHIIEPPQFFQQLKRRVNQQERATVREPQRKMRISRPTGASVPQMKVKEPQPQPKKIPKYPMAMKVDRPAARPYVKPRADGDQLPAASAQLQMQLPPPALPREILASVRKTERLLQQKQQQQQEQRIKQRHKTLQTHTVIMEQAHASEQQQRLQAHKVGGQKWQRKRRTRRAAPARRIASSPKEAHQTLSSAKRGIQQGNKLLLHINDLLKYADAYLPEQGEVRELTTPRASYNHNTNLSVAVVRELRMFLENSLNASNLLKRAYKGGEVKVETRRAQRQSLQHAANNATDAAAALSGSLIRHTPRAQLDWTFDSAATATLLYDDVMTNIRNMLQAKNLKLLEEQLLDSANSSAYVHVDNAPPAVSDDMSGLVQLQRHIEELQRVVTQLPHSNSISSNNNNNIDGVELLNAPMYESTTSLPPTEWYLIDADGKIYGTALATLRKPSATLFHRFPDIPVERTTSGFGANQTLLPLDALFV